MDAPYLRRATAANLPAVVDCVAAAFTPYIERMGRPPAPMLADYASLIGAGRVWLAELGGRLAGVLVQYGTDDGFYVDTVAVYPSRQGMGVGRALLAFAERTAADGGYASVYLCTNARMIENQIFYPRIGYVEYDRRSEAGYDRIYYRKAVMPAPAVQAPVRTVSTERRPHSKAAAIELVRPAKEHLAGYVAALERGWSADNARGSAAAREELARIEADPEGFLARLDDREATGPPVELPDGSLARRIPGFHRWIRDGEFAGSIGFRWQPGTPALPPHCLGHIGYAIVPWKQRRGYATRALGLLLPAARAEGLPHVEITTDPENLASQRVIVANGGVLVERFVKPPQFGGKPGLRYRILL